MRRFSRTHAPACSHTYRKRQVTCRRHDRKKRASLITFGNDCNLFDPKQEDWVWRRQAQGIRVTVGTTNKYWRTLTGTRVFPMHLARILSVLMGARTEHGVSISSDPLWPRTIAAKRPHGALGSLIHYARRDYQCIKSKAGPATRTP